MILTDRLVLREMRMSDLEDFYEIFSSEGVSRFIHKMSYQDVEKYFEKKFSKPQNPFSFAVELKGEEKMIGTCAVKVAPDSKVGTLSFVFNPKFWNQGFCTEACIALFEYCFEAGVERIEADCFEDNFASIKVLKDKLKMRREEKAKTSYNEFTHKMTNYLFFSMSKEEFLKNKNV